MSNLVQQARNAQQGKTIQQMLAPIRTPLGNALADRIGVERFVQAAVTTFRKTPGLARCTEESILGGLFVAAQLGLEVGGPRGLCYLVPYGREATLVIGVRGWIEMFYRAGARSVGSDVVREGDRFRMGSNSQHGRYFEWEPLNADTSRPLVGVIATVETAAGGIVWEYMTKDQILARRPAKWTGGPWETWPEEMAQKTVLRALQKRAPASSELGLAADSDQTVQRRVPGLPELEVTRVPVQGAVEGKSTPPAPEDIPDEEADYEEQSRLEHQQWLDEQAAMDNGGEMP